jgi:hypothetical protein
MRLLLQDWSVQEERRLIDEHLGFLLLDGGQKDTLRRCKNGSG